MNCRNTFQKGEYSLKLQRLFLVLILTRTVLIGSAATTPSVKELAKMSDSMYEVYEAANKILTRNSRTGSFADIALDVELQSLSTNSSILHLGGPMIGHIRHDGATLWLRTSRPAAVIVLLAVNGSLTSFGPVYTNAETQLVALVNITGLTASTTYNYTVLIDNNPISLPETAAITTAPLPDTAGMVRIAFGADSHVWGLSNQNQADAILRRKPVGLLLLGDIAVHDNGIQFGRHRASYLRRDMFLAWRTISASIPIYASWDDHDYLGNDVGGKPAKVSEREHKELVEVWMENWVNPYYGFGNHTGIFFRTRIGPVDIIMTDNRWFRKWPEAVPGNGYLGLEQMKWLEEQLLLCQGPFIIISSGCMWSDVVNAGTDSWGDNDPAGRERIFSLIEDLDIAGVLLISGDSHGSRVFTIPRPSGFKFYEFESGSMGGWTQGPRARKASWSSVQLFGSKGVFEFGEFTFDTNKLDPEVRFRSVAEDGLCNYEITLSRSQLTPSRASLAGNPIEVRPLECDAKLRTQMVSHWFDKTCSASDDPNHPPCYLEQHFDIAFPKGLTVGMVTNRYITLSFTQIRMINSGGKLEPLPEPEELVLTGYHQNSLFSETVALTLNIHFWPPLNETVIVRGEQCEGWSVQQVLDKANCFLAFHPDCRDSEIYQIIKCVDLVNRNYKYGKKNRRKLRCPGRSCSE